MLSPSHKKKNFFFYFHCRATGRSPFCFPGFFKNFFREPPTPTGCATGRENFLYRTFCGKIFVSSPTKKKYLKQYLPHTQRPTILTHLLKQTRQTTTTQPNNIITLPILILKTHRNTINKLRKTILITQNPIHQR